MGLMIFITPARNNGASFSVELKAGDFPIACFFVFISELM